MYKSLAFKFHRDGLNYIHIPPVVESCILKNDHKGVGACINNNMKSFIYNIIQNG